MFLSLHLSSGLENRVSRDNQTTRHTCHLYAQDADADCTGSYQCACLISSWEEQSRDTGAMTCYLEKKKRKSDANECNNNNLQPNATLNCLNDFM